ncbi:MAG: hypothetical protein M3O02_06885, partial [Acidobacteriota bacterium]|nr:hypothetical protein [Acidobacteriota bacterium]
SVALGFARPDGATHLVARLQPMRALQFPYVAMILLLGGGLGERVLGGVRWRWVAAGVLLGAPLYAAERGAYTHTQHVELPGRARSTNEWVQVFEWIRDHAPKDALFALDPEYIELPGEDAQCFRAIAERSALPDRSKDGGEAAIAPELTGAWVRGQAAQRGLSGEDDAARRRALGPLGVSWVVLAGSAATELECPFRTAGAKVCRLR